MIPQEIIRKKRDSEVLSKEEIIEFVNGLTNGSFSDAQIAAMSMAIFSNGMIPEETVHLTEAMTKSGDTINWSDINDSELVCDKHSTGGVGDKTSIFTFLNFPVCCVPYNLLNNGRMNAAVLPVPVWASPITSLPSNIIGIVFS